MIADPENRLYPTRNPVLHPSLQDSINPFYGSRLPPLASELEVPLIEMEAHFAAPEQAARDLRADGLDPNIEGNRVYARRVFKFFLPRKTDAETRNSGPMPSRCL